MLTNRSAPHARVTPVLTVRDVRAAVTWYASVFGFVEHVQIGEGHRAQLGLPGGGELIVAEVGPGRGERQATIDDVFGHQWVLTQTLVDTDPAQWGGKTVTPRRG